MGASFCSTGQVSTGPQHEIARPKSLSREKGIRFEEGYGYCSGPENLDFLNLLFKSYWSKFDAVAREVADTQMASLQQKLPSFLKGAVDITKFSLGTGSPQFGRITGQSHLHGVRLTCDFKWSSDLTVELAFKPEMLGKLLSIGLKSICIKGQLSVFPQIRDEGQLLAGWGATAYFIDAPEVDIDFTGLANTADLPGIRHCVRSVIEEMISSQAVLPNAIALTLGSVHDNAKTSISTELRPAPIGALRVTLVKANRLKSGDMNLFGMMGHLGQRDKHYMTLSLGGATWKSHSVDPDTHHALMVHDLQQTMRIAVWDDDVITSDDKIGQAGPFNVKEALALSGTSVQLADPNGSKEPSGTLEFQVTWLKPVPKSLGKDGCFICVKVSSISLPLQVASAAKLSARLQAGESTKEVHTRVVHRSRLITEKINAQLEQHLDKLSAEGLSPANIAKVKKANSSVLGAQVKMGLITELYLYAASEELANGVLHINLLVQQAKKFVSAGQPWTTRLDRVVKAKDMTLEGPLSLGASNGEAIEADATVEIWGLIPTSVESN
eukprot:TRINITY_DN3442_c0_g1_i1.p1 TRINITY_DN3442_c0_g1~~TRINITY_DN3442_c0_g1_i1.p1  ORF type:complete len:568 (+),score=100.83 TRINITY_DN3442_c0_g1_i1:46-1704(+)